MTNYVCGFMFSEDRQLVALIEKQKPDFLKGLWNGIGGKIEHSEVLEEAPGLAMAREFLEETGVATKISEWELFCQHTWSNGNEVWFFKCFSDKVYNVKTMEKEPVRMVRIVYANRYMHLKENLRWLIPMALDDEVTFADVTGTMK